MWSNFKRYHQLLRYLTKYLERKINIKNISIIGVGMGNVQDLSQKVIETIKDSDVLIGAKRMLDMFNHDSKYTSYIPNDISNYIENSNYQNYVILMSGDTGFFSGTDKLLPLIKHHNVVVHSGISSVSYLSSKIGVSWNGSKILSIHGRECNYISAIDRNSKVFLLTGGNVEEVCNSLIYYNLEVDIIIGENLSQEGEKISQGKPWDFIGKEFSTLSIMYIENPNAKNVTRIGIPDSEFIRGKVPMTKSEIRAVSISKCNIEETSICWDIGAGTGSVSVEMAMLCSNGKVYAVEKNHEGVELIKDNCKKFRLSNVEIIEDNAEKVIQNLPMPNIIFIGGSGGELSKILDVALEKNPNVRVVLNCVTLETLTQTLDYLSFRNIKDYDITQVGITHINKVSKYNMLKAENPIFIISF
ncbi:MAG: precorrin-6y C5,15-methyltransferase (decarboxylating) subunit CbiE [Oscillospiraceae bacterium]